MTATATKTLEATLAPPTTGKEQRLKHTVATYRQALEDSFESGADTQTAVNEIVTPYDLTSYAKDALKNYVPQLRRTYGASELEDDHPVRFTNRGLQIDHSEERTYEFCWRIPQAGRGNAFWIPLRINPEQESLWFDLLEESVTVGEFRLQQYRTNWVLHVTVEYEVAEPEIPDEPTPIGFDIGESKLLTGCACQNGTPTQPYIYDGSRARALRKEMYTTLKRLQKREAAEWRVDERFTHYQNALTDIVEKASREAVEYAASFENPVIVLEDLSSIRENLDYGKYMNRRLHSWAFARLTDRIEDKALEAGIPVRFVNPQYTSQTCHACGHIGRRGSQAEFTCTNPECWVTEYQADINATVNVAGRFDPWGESVPWKPERNVEKNRRFFDRWKSEISKNSPRNGSRCDTATGHRTLSR